MKHIRGMKRYGKILIFYSFIRATIIGVVQPTGIVSIHRHLVRHQGIQSNDFIFTVADDLCIGVAPKEQVRHKGFPKHEGAHLRVRLIVEQVV